MNHIWITRGPRQTPAATLKPACLALISALLAWPVAAAAKNGTTLAQVEFSDQFFPRSGEKAIDLSRFARGNPVPSGSYRVDLYVNGGWIGRTEVGFKDAAGSGIATPCVTAALLMQMGVDMTRLTPSAAALLSNADGSTCIGIADVIAEAGAEYDSSELRLDLSIPQAMLRRSARGYVSPELWDSGVTAAFVGYNFNTYRLGAGATSSQQSYLGLNGGVNLGNWYLRHTASVVKQDQQPLRYSSIATYAQTGLPAIGSQLTLGQTFTSGRLFDSFALTGVQLASDPRMLPDSQSGYAPVVRGVARTNAKVRITQNGNILYETTVAPGPFEINDLYPTGYGGDLNVMITEADGSVQSYAVPYAALAELLRPGSWRYSLSTGQTRNAGWLKQIPVLQGTLEHGMSNDLTLSGGVQLASGYAAAVAGAAVNTPIGAVAADTTYSRASFSGGHMRSGQSTRVTYSKQLHELGTNFSLAAYRYSSRGYLTLNDAGMLQDNLARGGAANEPQQRRNSLLFNISQTLGEKRGTLSAVGTTENYWNRPGSTTTFQLSYSNSLGPASYNLSARRQKDVLSGAVSTQFSIGLSIPLGREIHSPSLYASAFRGNGGTSLQSSLSGTAGEQSQFSYGVSANRDGSGVTSQSVNGQYRTSVADFAGSYGRGNGTSQMSASISGGLVAHPGGVTLSQSLGDTIAVVEARDAAGAELPNTNGVAIDRRGYAVVPYLTAYRVNEIGIDPKGLSTDVELKSTSQQIVPRAGAVVMVKFDTVTGRSAVIDVTQADGQPLPFGATIHNEQGTELGLAGQAGRVFVRGIADSGELTAKWGNTPDAQCSFSYRFAPRATNAKGVGFDTASAACRTKAGTVVRNKGMRTLSEAGTVPVTRAE